MHRFFFALLLVFLPAQLGYHMWPEWAFVLGRRVDYLSPTLYLTDIFLLLTVASGILESFVIPSLSRNLLGVNLRSELLRMRGFHVWMRSFDFTKNVRTFLVSLRMTGKIGMVLLFVGINIFFSQSPPVAIYHWLKVLEFFLLGYYIVTTKPSFLFIIWHVSFGIFYSSLIAIWQFYLQHSIGGLLWFLGERTFSLETIGIARTSWCFFFQTTCPEFLRSYATFPHPNVLGGFLAVTLPLVLQMIITCRTIHQREIEKFSLMSSRITSNNIVWWLGTVLFFGHIALMLTFSRSAWVAIGMSYAFFVLRSSHARKYRHWIISFSAVGLIALGSLLFSSFAKDDESVLVRQQLQQSAVAIWQTSPVFGVGLGNFLVTLPYFLPTKTIYFLQPVHNIYLLILSETGIVGVGVILLLLWKIVHYPLSIIHYPLSILLLLLLGLVDHYPLTVQQGQLLLTLFLSLAIMKNKNA